MADKLFPNWSLTATYFLSVTSFGVLTTLQAGFCCSKMRRAITESVAVTTVYWVAALEPLRRKAISNWR
jgi:hypothetical protein